MKISRNQITGIILALAGLVITILTMQFRIDMTAEYPGPKLFPLIAGVGMLLLGIGIFFEKEPDDKQVVITNTMLIRLIKVFALTILYVLGLKYFGFLLSSPIYVFVACLLFSKASLENKSKIWMFAVFAVAVSVFIYVVYTMGFSLRLPRGSLTGF